MVTVHELTAIAMIKKVVIVFMMFGFLCLLLVNDSVMCTKGISMSELGTILPL